MPDETLSALADTATGSMFNSGVTFNAYDVLANVIQTWSPGPTAGTWATSSSTYRSVERTFERHRLARSRHELHLQQRR
jgi:hypothetical protein